MEEGKVSVMAYLYSGLKVEDYELLLLSVMVFSLVVDVVPVSYLVVLVQVLVWLVGSCQMDYLLVDGSEGR